MRAKLRHIIAVAILALLLVSCRADERFATYPNANPDGFGQTASLIGHVVNLDGCFLILADATGVEWLPVFPRWTNIGSTLQINQKVELQGGFLDGGIAGMRIPDDCRRDVPRFLVVETR